MPPSDGLQSDDSMTSSKKKTWISLRFNICGGGEEKEKNLCEPSIITEGRMAIGGTATLVMMRFSGLSDRKSNSQSCTKKDIMKIKMK